MSGFAGEEVDGTAWILGDVFLRSVYSVCSLQVFGSLCAFAFVFVKCLTLTNVFNFFLDRSLISTMTALDLEPSHRIYHHNNTIP